MHTAFAARAVALAAGTALALGLTACSDTGGKRALEQQAAAGGHANTPRMTVALITHSGPGDTFWDQVRKGAQDAADKDNVELQYFADPDGAAQARLVRQAVDKKVDGIAVTLSKPEAMTKEVTAAVDEGTPTVALNGGMEEWQDMGVSAFFGQDEVIAGEAAGDRLTQDGAGKVLCVIHEQGNVGHEQRCEGVKKGFAETEKIYVTGTDMANVESTITAKLQQDKDIDTIITLGAPFAMTAVDAAKTAGSQVTITTFDLNDDAVGAIKDGRIAWAVDQQPYLQGYLAVDSLWLAKNKGAMPGGGEPVLTGPAFVDKGNVDLLEGQSR